MSRTSEVLKTKNKRKKIREARKREEIENLKKRSAYQARLSDELERIDTLLDSDDIEAVKVSVPQDLIARFTESIYTEAMAEYEITQSEENPLEFYIKRKYIAL